MAKKPHALIERFDHSPLSQEARGLALSFKHYASRLDARLPDGGFKDDCLRKLLESSTSAINSLELKNIRMIDIGAGVRITKSKAIAEFLREDS